MEIQGLKLLSAKTVYDFTILILRQKFNIFKSILNCVICQAIITLIFELEYLLLAIYYDIGRFQLVLNKTAGEPVQCKYYCGEC